MKYSYDPPIILKKIFPGYKWNTSNGRVLLTFDDGPIPETTEIILKDLEKYKIKAVFFCVGSNVKRYPSLCKSILQAGHMIGNHTFNHTRLSLVKASVAEEEILRFNHLLYENFGYEVKYFRPPHGRFTLRLADSLRDLGMNNVMWSLLTFDYKNNLNIVKFALENYLKSNSIVVFHDSLKSRGIIVDSIKNTVDKVISNGYEFGDPTECLR